MGVIRKKSFTIIELVISIGVLMFILPITFSIVFSILRQELSTSALIMAKRDSDNLLGIMKNTVKDRAMSIHSGVPTTLLNEVCSSLQVGQSYISDAGVTKNMYFQDKYGAYFHYTLLSGRIASASSSMTPSSVNLTNSKITISSFRLECMRQSEFSAPVISVSFTSTFSSFLPSFSYFTKFKLLNY